MTPSNAPANRTRPAPIHFADLVRMRLEWRAFHARQDSENADRIFGEADLGSIHAGDLKFFPEAFRRKLAEFGRDWERALAARGLREGFSFYEIPLTVDVERVGELHAWVESTFGSAGAPLIFESVGAHAVVDGRWEAILSFALRPGVRADSLGFASSPGVLRAGPPREIA